MFANVEPAAAINFKERYTASTWNIGNLDELDSAEPFGAWGFNLIAEECLKVVEISQLTWLAHSFATREALVAVELEAVVNVAEVAHEEKQGTDGSTCSSFPRIAVNDQTVFRIGYI